MQRLNILFVDNDQHTHDKIHHALETGFAVHCASSVTEAKDALNNSAPDMLICEVLLGQENGLDLCRYVRNKSLLHDLPIMILTSLTTLQDKVAGFDAGADDYVVKPFDAYHLMARIRLLMRIKRLEHRITS